MIDFKAIISQTDRYNFHSHTQYCDGRAAMADFAAAAAAAGFRHWGFTPHSPLIVPSPCNMSTDDVPAYLEEVSRLRCLYPDGPRFYASMEIDFLSREWGPAVSYFQDLPLDYRIGSVHFVKAPSGDYVDIDGSYETFARKLHTYFRDDLRYVVNLFYEATLEMIDLGGFDIIGHYDKIGNNADFVRKGIEQEGWYRDLAEEATEALIKSDVAVEINTKAYDKCSRFFPEISDWPRLVDAGVTLLVNSDTHYPELHSAGRSEAFELLGKIKAERRAQ